MYKRQAEDAAGAVDGGEGLVELRHLAADVAFAFHEEHVEARVGAVEGGLDAGHAAADDEHAFGGFEGLGEQRVVAAQFFNGEVYKRQLLGSLPSDGRLMWPPVGPEADMMRSYWSEVMTSGYWPAPYSP